MLCEWPSPSDGTERLLHFVRGQRHLAQTDPACIRYRVGKSGGRGALGGFAGAQKRETWLNPIWARGGAQAHQRSHPASVARLKRQGFQTHAPASADAGETKPLVRQGTIEVKVELNFVMRRRSIRFAWRR
jgi:hypothetical protein